MRAARRGQLLVDTDVLSFFFNRDSSRVPRYRPRLEGSHLYVSFASIAEMRYGAILRGWGARRCAELDAFLADYEVVESSPAIGAAWAGLRVGSMRVGKTMGRQDAWIAAAALVLDIPLVTHNSDDFSHIPALQIITEPDPRP